MGNNQRARTLLLWMMMALMAYLVMNLMAQPDGRPHNVQISSFSSLVEDGTIGWVNISGGHVHGISKDRKDIYMSFTAEPKMIRDALKAKRVPFREEPPDDGSTAMIVIQMVLFGAMLFFLFRMISAKGAGPGAAMKFGSHKGKLAVQVKERFTDVAGVDEAVDEIRDIVDFLKNPREFERLGATMPKGTLLVGPPGTGKTLLARALAGEAGVPFLSISGSEFVEMFVGVGASRVRDLFQEARRYESAIIFIDELDALGKKRGNGSMFGGHDEREQTLNQLLVEMDGFQANSGLMVIAATNQPESLDPALTRAGRFGRQVLVPPPDKAGREAIIRIHMRKKLGKFLAAPDLDLGKVAKNCAGFTGADLEHLVNEAALRATKAKKAYVDTADFIESVERVIAGAERKGTLLTEDVKRIVAWHESGHAVAGWFSPGADPVHRVSIIPRGASALGYTMSIPDNDRHLYRKSELLARIRMTLGGRAAEQLILGEDVTSGASNDFAQATTLAQRMVTQFALSGMTPRTYGVHQAGFLGEHVQRDYSDYTAQRIDKEVGSIIEKCFSETLELLKKHHDKLKSMAEALLAEETLDDERVLAILGPRES